MVRWRSGGSGSGGGTTTTNNTTTNQTLPWAGYVPPETYAAYKNVLPQIEARATTGLTPEEKAYYTGQGLTDVNQATAGASKALTDNLARSGVKGGAAAEAYSDLARSSVTGKAGMVSQLQGMDITQKNANVDRLLKAIALPGSPITTGTTNTGVTNYNPSGSSGGGGS